MIDSMRFSRPRLRLPVLIFAGATLLGLIFTFQSFLRNYSMKPENQSPWLELGALEMSGCYLYAILSVLVLKMARRFPIDQYSWKRLAVVHFSAAFVFACLHLMPHAYIAWAAGRKKWTFPKFLVEEDIICPYRILWRMMIYFAFLFVCYAIDFHRQSRASQAKALLLEKELKRAKLEGLKSQLSPDLLFATLRDVSSLIAKDVERADRLIARLGSFLRSCLESAGKPLVRVSQEVNLLEAYSEIQKIRLEQQVEIQLKVDEQVLDAPIPNLFLFQLIEMVIRKEKTGRTTIQLQLTRAQEFLKVQLLCNCDSPISEQCKKELEFRIESVYALIGRLHLRFDETQIFLNLEVPLQLASAIEMQISSPDVHGLTLEEFRRSIEPDHQLLNLWKRRSVQTIFIFGIWTLLGIYFQAREIHYARIAIVWKEFLLSFLPWYIWALATPLVFKLYRRYPITKEKWIRNVPIHTAACLAIWIVITIANAGVWSVIEHSTTFLGMLGQSFFYSRIAINILIYWTLIAIAIAASYYGRYRHEEVRGSKLQIKIMEAQLEAIRMQLQPHFLFNTLNSISELMHENVRGAEQMLKRLEEFLRLTLRNEARQELTLREEIEFLRCYLEIQQMRFQDRLKVEINIEEGVMEHLVPSLLCQPIIENAIRHGISPLLSEGRIQIIAERENGMLSLQIKDNGPGLPPAGEWREGFGLSNTRAMLSQLYGEKHQLQLQNSTEGGLTVTVKIPAVISNGYH